MKVVNTYRSRDYWNHTLTKGGGMCYDLKSEKKTLRTLLVDVMSVYAWRVRPDGYDVDSVFEIVKKLLESQNIGYEGDMRQHVESRLRQNLEFLDSGKECQSSDAMRIVENSYLDYIGNTEDKEILLVRIGQSVPRMLAVRIVNDIVPERVDCSESFPVKSDMSVPLFGLLSWVVLSLIDGTNVGEVFRKPYYTANLCATKRKNSARYTTSVSKLMFAMMCVIEETETVNDHITLMFELNGMQALFPTRIFDEERANYNLVFIGDDDAVKNDTISAFLDMAHERSLRSGENLRIGNRNHREIRVVSGSSTFRIYDMCATSGLERLYCVLREVSSDLDNGYVLVLVPSSQDTDRLEMQAEQCIRRGIPTPKSICILTDEKTTAVLKGPHMARNDATGYRLLENLRSRESGPSDESVEIADHLYFNLMSSLGIPYEIIDDVPSLSYPEGIRRTFDLMIGTNPHLGPGSLGLVLTAAFALDRAEKHMLRRDFETGLEERAFAWIDEVTSGADSI